MRDEATTDERIEVRRRVRTAARPTSVPCAGCGKDVPVRTRGPLPVWCGQTCRQRAWELRRAAAALAGGGASVAQREVVEVPVPLEPERSEWVGVLAELTRQVASHELPAGCMQPVYEALTVAINQLVHREQTQNYGRGYGFTSHPALPGRENVIAAQLATDVATSLAAQARWIAEIERAERRRDARLRRRFRSR
jgi:hypothetical protein